MVANCKNSYFVLGVTCSVLLGQASQHGPVLNHPLTIELPVPLFNTVLHIIILIIPTLYVIECGNYMVLFDTSNQVLIYDSEHLSDHVEVTMQNIS